MDSAAGAANPSSIHGEGVRAAAHLAAARRRAAAVLGVSPTEIVFTGGGTESNNLAVFGPARFYNRQFKKHPHIITSVIEHHSVLRPLQALEANGVSVTYLPVDKEGLVDPKEVERALRPETVLVSVMLANNEIGTIEPLKEIARVIRRWRQAQGTPYPYLHTDACQAPHYLDLKVPAWGVDLLTLNSAKLAGGAGVGLLYVRRGLELAPLLYGGGQENGWRSGTENVKGISAFVKALEKAQGERVKVAARLTVLRDYFISQILKLPGTVLNGPSTSLGAIAPRLPNNINISFADCEAEQLVLELDARGVAASAGAACSQPGGDTSYVVKALGRSEGEAAGALRLTLGPKTTKAELDYVLKILPPILQKLRRQIVD